MWWWKRNAVQEVEDRAAKAEAERDANIRRLELASSLARNLRTQLDIGKSQIAAAKMKVEEQRTRILRLEGALEGSESRLKNLRLGVIEAVGVKRCADMCSEEFV